MDNIQRLEEQADIKKMLDEIKSHREPPFREDAPYYSRKPWGKFGAVGGFVLGWGWYKDEYILAQTTPEAMK